VLMACAGLYRHTADDRWLHDALQLAARACELWWVGGTLPRIAIGHDHYEAQQMPGYFLHGLGELVMLADDPASTLLAGERSLR